MKFVTAQQMRELDRRTIEERGVAGIVLMERAGRGAARQLMLFSYALSTPRPTFLFIAGKGNNGGDAFVAARYLHQKGFDVHVWLAGRTDDVSGDARLALDHMRRSGVAWSELYDPQHWELDNVQAPLCDFVIDGLLGTGTQGEPRGVIARAVEFINEMGREAVAVSLDMPTGLDADSGLPSACCVEADFTITFGLPKTGFLDQRSWSHTGSIRCVDIGTPPDLYQDIESARGLEPMTDDDVIAVLPKRSPSAHKGDFGRVCCIGGSRSLTGAIRLAAQAAVRSGSGLVSVVTPESQVALVASACAEAMVSGGSENSDGALAFPLWNASVSYRKTFNALLAGPGMGRGDDCRKIVEELLAESRVPLVLDADALTVMKGRLDKIKGAQCPVVLTPHPGELAALLELDTGMIQSDRIQFARYAASVTGAIVVFKGAGTIVADPSGRARINLTGNSGMATGGTGDVLAGLLVGLLGQGVDPFEAACAAVHAHSGAGDMAMLRKSKHGLAASDLIEEVAGLFKKL